MSVLRKLHISHSTHPEMVVELSCCRLEDVCKARRICSLFAATSKFVLSKSALLTKHE